MSEVPRVLGRVADYWAEQVVVGHDGSDGLGGSVGCVRMGEGEGGWGGVGKRELGGIVM